MAADMGVNADLLGSIALSGTGVIAGSCDRSNKAEAFRPASLQQALHVILCFPDSSQRAREARAARVQQDKLRGNLAIFRQLPRDLKPQISTERIPDEMVRAFWLRRTNKRDDM